MAVLKSAVTFFRRELGLRGQTEHNGRGTYEMDVDDDLTTAELEARLRSCVAKWQTKGLIERVDEDARCINVTLLDNLFPPKSYLTFNNARQPYRTLVFHKANGALGVCMAFPR